MTALPRSNWSIRSIILTGLLAATVLTVFAQASFAQSEAEAQASKRAEAYYHYAAGHLYHKLAMQFVRREYVEKAIEEYKLAMEADPESPVIPQQLVRLYASVNRLDDAVALANQVIERQPDNADLYKLLGETYRSSIRDRQSGVDPAMLNSAIEQFEKALEIRPDDKQALLDISVLYRVAGQRGKAEDALRKALELDSDSPEALGGLADILMDTGQVEEAVDLFEKIIRTSGADPRYLNALAEAYERAGRHEDAADAYERILEQVEDDGGSTISIRRSLAENLARSGRLDEARQQYEQLLLAEPRNALYHLRLSQIHRERRRFQDAREHLEQAKRLGSSEMQIEIRYAGVQLLERERRFEEAIAELEEILTATEKSNYESREAATREMFLEYLASLSRDNKDFEGARKAYERIAELNPESKPRSRALTIDSFRAERKYDRAVEESAAAVKEFKDSRPLMIQRATLLAETGAADAGAKLLDRLLEGDRSDLEIHLTLAQVWEKGKEYDKALEAVDRAHELADSEPAKLNVLFTHGSVLERAKRFEEAEQKFRELLEIDPDNAAALNYLGYMLADQGVKLDEAHDMIQKALDSDPDNGAYLDSLGWVYYRKDKLELAERYLLRSLEQYQHDPVVLTHLGDVYYKQGEKEKARRHWEKGLEEWRRSPVADRDSAEIARLEEKLAGLGSAAVSQSDENTGGKKGKRNP